MESDTEVIEYTLYTTNRGMEIPLKRIIIEKHEVAGMTEDAADTYVYKKLGGIDNLIKEFSPIGFVMPFSSRDID